MAKNQQLEEAVVEMMAREVFERDPVLRFMTDGQVEGAITILSSIGKVRVDEDFKLRLDYHGFFGYGYDFSKKDEDGKPAREVFERAVENTRKRVLGDMGETLLHDEVKDGRIGLYLTHI